MGLPAVGQPAPSDAFFSPGAGRPGLWKERRTGPTRERPELPSRPAWAGRHQIEKSPPIRSSYALANGFVPANAGRHGWEETDAGETKPNSQSRIQSARSAA